jgi:transcriptional regulator with XRE-family HTH domain
MVKVSDLKTASQIAEEEMEASPAIRREVERTALANAVAIRVIEYRADHDLSQMQLARQLGMHQSAIARLEAGDHEPSLSTLARLAKGMEIDFQIDISHEGQVELRSVGQDQQEQPMEHSALQALLQSIAASIRALRWSREAIELGFMSQPERFPRDLGGGTKHQTMDQLLVRWKANRGREEEEDVILVELERLLHDEEKVDEVHQNARSLNSGRSRNFTA